MSVPYHLELFNNGFVRLLINFSNIKHDIADENITFHIYAINQKGIPIFTQELGINELRILYKHLDAISIIREGNPKSSKFIETSDEINTILEQLKESDLNTILKLLANYHSSEKVNGLLSSLSDLEIINLHGAYHHKIVTKELSNLQILLDLEDRGNITTEINHIDELIKYTAGQPEKIFQNWIEQNLWIFGIEYIKKHDVRKIALFSEGDLLMESVDGYLDLIELKRPKHELLKYDIHHKCFYPHPDLSQVIGQSLFYLQKLLQYKSILQEEYQVKILMPRVKIIAGRNKDYTAEQYDCLRMLNTNLNSMQIITFDDLITYGKLILNSNQKHNPNIEEIERPEKYW